MTVPTSTKSSRRGLLIVVVVIIILIASIGGYSFYQFSLQPDIHATNLKYVVLETTPKTQVMFDDIIIESHTFSYEATQSCTCKLVFDWHSEYFWLSGDSRLVELRYMVAGQSHNLSLKIPLNEQRFVSVELLKGDVISGSFSVIAPFWNEPADVKFRIIVETCSQTVRFEFTLVNSGTADGYATIITRLDDAEDTIWSNKYYIPKRQKLTESVTVSIPDCLEHKYSSRVESQTKA